MSEEYEPYDDPVYTPVLPEHSEYLNTPPVSDSPNSSQNQPKLDIVVQNNITINLVQPSPLFLQPGGTLLSPGRAQATDRLSQETTYEPLLLPHDQSFNNEFDMPTMSQMNISDTKKEIHVNAINRKSNRKLYVTVAICGGLLVLATCLVIFLLAAKSSARSECESQLSGLNQWLNESRESIRGYVDNGGEALQCHQFTPVPHHVLQSILKSYEPLNKSCDQQKVNEERETEDQLMSQIKSKLNNFTQSLLNCLDQPYLNRSDYKRANDFLSENLTVLNATLTLHLRGVTVVDDKIYVVQREQPFISVFNSSDLSVYPDINVPEMKDLRYRYITGCSYYKVIYISDAGCQCILRVNLDNGSVKSWTIGDSYVPYGLSVTAERNLLVTLFSLKRNAPYKVVTYNSTGYQLHEILLHNSSQPRQTVELSTDRFILCRFGDDPGHLHQVCTINSGGEVIRCFGGEKGGGEDQLGRPRSLTVDYDRKRIFVADHDNNRIVMLDYNMTYLGRMKLKFEIQPYRLHFDPLLDQLVAGQGGRSSVLYAIRPQKRL